MNIALLQLHCWGGHPERNALHIAKAVQGACIATDNTPLLCVAPELALCGSPLANIPSAPGFLRLCAQELAMLAKELCDGPPLILGTLDRTNDGLQSAVYLLEGGEMHRLFGRPLVDGLAFGQDRSHSLPAVQCFSWNNKSFALWLGTPGTDMTGPVAGLAVQADFHLNLDAAAFEPTFWIERHKRLSHLARCLNKPVLRVNGVGGNGPYIFPGGTMTLDANGCVRTEAVSFTQELLVEPLNDLTLAKPVMENESNAGDETANDCSFELNTALWDALILGLRDYVHGSGFEQVILGLSGGMDSSLVAALAVDALGAANVLGVLMPSPWSSAGSISDAQALADNLGMETHTLPIGPLMEAYDVALIPLFLDTRPDATEENLQARIRGNLLMALSNKFGGMVLSTSNKSEAAVGYGTLYGDMAGGLAPIVDLYKTEIYTLARWYNQHKNQIIIPENVFVKPPSAELRPGQTDQDSLPPYEALDPFLRQEIKGTPLPENAPRLTDVQATKMRRLLWRSEFKRQQAILPLFVSARPLALSRRPLPV